MSNPSFSDPQSDEVLSAYIDGELSPAEVLAVERWLKSSPQALQKLADFRRLSGLLQDLPQEELPEEFAGQVLAQAERQMLLPAQRNVGVPSVIRRVRFWAVSVGLPVAAACLLVAIQWNRNGEAPEVADVLHKPLPKSAPGREEIASNALPSKTGDDVRPMRAASAALADATDSETAPHEKSRQQDSRPPAITATDTASNGLESGTGTRRPEESRPAGNDSVLTVLNQIKEFNDSGKIPVVRIFVVDRQDGLEVLQVMLEGKNIARDEPSSPSASRGHEESTSDKRALFVVASAGELTSALKSLEEKSGGIGSWMLSDPVELARFDQTSQTRMSEVLALVAGSRPEPPTGIVAGATAAVAGSPGRDVASTDDPSKRPPRRSSPRKNVGNRGNSTPERATSPDRDGGGLADIPIARSGRRGGPGRQVLVTMDEPASPSRIEGTPGTTQTRIPENSRGGPGGVTAPPTESPAVDPGIRSAALERQSPMRVLFVIERQTSPPAAAPPAKESPGGGAA